MFTSKLKNILVAGTIALGAIAAVSATTTSANAGGRGGVYIGGPGIEVRFGDWGPRFDRPRFDRRARCQPRRALRKAKNRGVRRAHIVRVGHRGVVVAGLKWGDRVVMKFGGHRSCPIRSVRHR